MQCFKAAISVAIIVGTLVLCGISSVRAEMIGVFVSILPQAYFVERLGEPHVDVSVLVGPGQSPHTFQPSPRQMAALGEARLYFRIGSAFEGRMLEKIRHSLPDLTIVDTRRGVPLLYFEETGRHGHRREGHGCGGRGSTADPHIWLDPGRVKIQARTIAEALVSADPERGEHYRRNLEAFEADLDRIDERIREQLAPLRGRDIYVFHPAFGYFADSYGLRQVAVEIDGKEPAPRQLAALTERARNDGVRVIFVQPQFSPLSAETIAREIGGAVVPIDPLARDYLANMEYLAKTIRKYMAAAAGTNETSAEEDL